MSAPAESRWVPGEELLPPAVPLGGDGRFPPPWGAEGYQDPHP